MNGTTGYSFARFILRTTNNTLAVSRSGGPPEVFGYCICDGKGTGVVYRLINNFSILFVDVYLTFVAETLAAPYVPR